MAKRRKVTAVILCGVFLAVAHIRAEDAPKDSDPFKFSISVSGEYTDNRDATKAEESNFDTYVTPGIDLIIKDKRANLDLYYEPAYRNRSDPGLLQNNDQLQHNLGLNGEYKFIPALSLLLRERFNYTDDPSVQEGGTTLRRDQSFNLNRLETGLSYKMSRRSHTDLMGRHSIKRFDDATISKESNEENLAVSLASWRQVSRTLGVVAEAEASAFEYDNSTVERGFSALTGKIGGDQVFSGNFRGGLRLGWKTLDYEANDLGSENAPFVDLSLRMSTAPSTRITAGLSHVLRNSDVYPFASQKYTDFSTRFEWDAVANTTLGLGSTYRVGDYDSESLSSKAKTVAQGAKTSGEETAVLITADVACNLDPIGTIKLAQHFEDLDSIDEKLRDSFTRNSTNLSWSRAF